MNISEFTNIFLPQLLSQYIDGDLPFHALVDTDLWKQVFPETNNLSFLITKHAKPTKPFSIHL